MANRVREDEKHERIIRGLLKLPDNRRCINCNSLGPQYVCINFWTFVCTTCSGIHREFTHRVKSISMAKFTPQEVAALQEGGNQRARDIYFKEWDPQRQTAPDSSNVDRLRDFIKHVYVDRRYSVEKNYGKPPSVKMGDKEDSYDNRRTDAYQGGSRSPPYDDSYERRYSDRSSPGGRSPGYEESRQYNEYRRSPGRPEVVNDWRREDRFGNGKKADDRRVSDGDARVEGRSPERLKDAESSSPPIVRPVREILGDNVVPLRISEPPKPNFARPVTVSAQTQRTASSSSLGSNNGNPVEIKLENTASLIDFDADPEPPVTTATPQAQQTSQSIAQPTSTSNDNNWASFDFAPEVKAHPPSTANPLESVLSQLSVTTAVPVQVSGVPSSAPVVASVGNVAVSPIAGSFHVSSVGNPSALTFNTGAPAGAQVMSAFPPGGVSGAAHGLAPNMPFNGSNSFVKASEAGQWASMPHQQPSLFPTSSIHSTGQPFPPTLGVASGNQVGQVTPPQVVSNATYAGLSQPSAVDTNSIGRRELPVDLFTATYSSFPAMHPGWHTGPPRGMGFPIQYSNVPVSMQSFPQPSKSANPFDLGEATPVQPQAFPSMASLHGALPNMLPSSGLQRNSSGTPSPAWMQPQSLTHPSAFPSQSPPYVSAMPPRAYTTQVQSSMPLSGHQGAGTFGAEGLPFGAINMDQQLAGRFSAPATPQPFSSVGGNPFG